MKIFFNRLPWSIVIVLIATLGLAPFVPQPHLFEKLQMLANGELKQAIDIFDLILHASPLVILILKLFFHFSKKEQ